MNRARNISERMRIVERSDGAELHINGQIERWKMTLLSTWLLAWIFVGSVVIAELFSTPDRDMKVVLTVFLAFWAYYFWKVGQVWLYRQKGYERIALGAGTITVTRRVMGKGRTERYFLDNIEVLKEIEIPKRSWASNYENLWWVMGGEKVGFDYGGKFVRFGMQLNEKETAELLRFLQKGFAKYREKAIT